MKPEIPTPKSKIVLIGIGNEYRSDDGLGLEIVRQLNKMNLPNTVAIEQSGDGIALMELLQKADTVFLFDAVHSGSAKPGTIHRLNAHQRDIPRRFFNYSTHDFSVAEAIELTRTLDQLPSHLILYGIEGAVFSTGAGFSPEVNAAISKVLSQVLSEIKLLPGVSRVSALH